MIRVEVHDGRGGHDGVANGGHFGSYTQLLVKPKEGVLLEEAVYLVSDEDRGFYQSGNCNNRHETDRTTIFLVDPDKVEWACVEAGYDAQPGLGGMSSRRSWDAVPGLPSGPRVELQRFLEAYPRWVDENVPLAERWLGELARRRGDEGLAAKIGYARQKVSKGRISSAWADVAADAGVEKEATWNGSWTGVRSAPLRIALAIQKKYKVEWGLVGSLAFRWSGTRPTYPKGELNGCYALPGGVDLRKLKSAD